MPLNKVQSEYVAATPTDGDSVAAFLNIGAGNLTGVSLLAGAVLALDVRSFTADIAGNGITSTLVSAKQALDVNVVQIASGSGFDVEGNVADGASDSTTKPVKIGYQAAGAIPAAATSGQRVNAISDLYRRVYVNDSSQIAFKTTQGSVANTSALLVTTALAGRRRLQIQNDSAKSVYIGPTTVTASGANIGIRIPGNGGFYENLIGDQVAVYAIAATAGPFLVTVAEFA